MPYWKLASRLESLKFSGLSDDPFEAYKAKGDKSETELASYELPEELPAGYEEDDWEALSKISCSVLERTIVAAARNGRLKHLDVNGIDAPFAVPSLLPCWVTVRVVPSYYGSNEGWYAAAMMLRPLLSLTHHVG